MWRILPARSVQGSLHSPIVLASAGEMGSAESRLSPAMSSVEKEPFHLEFHVAADGKTTAVTHTFTMGAGPVRVPRLHELPVEWKSERTACGIR